MPAFCYILFSEKLNKYYVGSTPDIERRLGDHNREKKNSQKPVFPGCWFTQKYLKHYRKH